MFAFQCGLYKIARNMWKQFFFLDFVLNIKMFFLLSKANYLSFTFHHSKSDDFCQWTTVLQRIPINIFHSLIFCNFTLHQMIFYLKAENLPIRWPSQKLHYCALWNISDLDYIKICTGKLSKLVSSELEMKTCTMFFLSKNHSIVSNLPVVENNLPRNY